MVTNQIKARSCGEQRSPRSWTYMSQWRRMSGLPDLQSNYLFCCYLFTFIWIFKFRPTCDIRSFPSFSNIIFFFLLCSELFRHDVLYFFRSNLSDFLRKSTFSKSILHSFSILASFYIIQSIRSLCPGEKKKFKFLFLSLK